MLKGSAANLLSSFYALLRSQYNYSIGSIRICNCRCPGCVTVSLVDVFVWRCRLTTKASCGLAWQTWAQHIAQPIPPIYPKSCLSPSYQFGWKVEYIRVLLSNGATKWVPKETTVSKEESYKQRLHQRSLEGMQDPNTDSIKDRLAIYAALFRPKTHTP